MTARGKFQSKRFTIPTRRRAGGFVKACRMGRATVVGHAGGILGMPRYRTAKPAPQTPLPGFFGADRIGPFPKSALRPSAARTVPFPWSGWRPLGGPLFVLSPIFCSGLRPSLMPLEGANRGASPEAEPAIPGSPRTRPLPFSVQSGGIPCPRSRHGSGRHRSRSGYDTGRPSPRLRHSHSAARAMGAISGRARRARGWFRGIRAQSWAMMASRTSGGGRRAGSGRWARGIAVIPRAETKSGRSGAT